MGLWRSNIIFGAVQVANFSFQNHYTDQFAKAATNAMKLWPEGGCFRQVHCISLPYADISGENFHRFYKSSSFREKRDLHLNNYIGAHDNL